MLIKLLEASEKLEKIVKYFLQMICDELHDLVLVTFWRLYDRSNTYKYLLTIFFYLSVISICLYEFQRGILTGRSNVNH